MCFSWSHFANKLLELFEKNISSRFEGNFDENYDVAAFRTITTIAEVHPELRHVTGPDLLKFDYTRLINWSLNHGLNDPRFRDYLIPQTKMAIELKAIKESV